VRHRQDQEPRAFGPASTSFRAARAGLVVLLLAEACGPARSGEELPAVDTPVVVSFNVVCAHCHEGECSGRLSFSSGVEGAMEHIRRYAGPVGFRLASQYFRLLERMKADCSIYPFPQASTDMEGERGLDRFFDPLGNGYFVPLGTLEPGEYELTLEFTEPWRGRAELVSARFDLLVDRCVGAEGESPRFSLRVDEEETHYLRLRAEKSEPSRLISYSLRATGKPAPQVR